MLLSDQGLEHPILLHVGSQCLFSLDDTLVVNCPYDILFVSSSFDSSNPTRNSWIIAHMFANSSRLWHAYSIAQWVARIARFKWTPENQSASDWGNPSESSMIIEPTELSIVTLIAYTKTTERGEKVNKFKNNSNVKGNREQMRDHSLGLKEVLSIYRKNKDFIEFIRNTDP